MPYSCARFKSEFKSDPLGLPLAHRLQDSYPIGARHFVLKNQLQDRNPLQSRQFVPEHPLCELRGPVHNSGSRNNHSRNNHSKALHVNQELGGGGVLSRLRIKFNVRSVTHSLSSHPLCCVFTYFSYSSVRLFIFVPTLAQLFAIVSRDVNQR